MATYDMDDEKRQFIVSVLKAGVLFTALLNDFERGFVQGIANDYARYGVKLKTSNKRLTTLAQIADKLCLKVKVPEFAPQADEEGDDEGR